MQANWSLILNVLLLVGVITAIGRLMSKRKQSINPERPQMAEKNSSYDGPHYGDDIIAVRKVAPEFTEHNNKISSIDLTKTSSSPRLIADEEEMSLLEKEIETGPDELDEKEVGPTALFFLLAKENRQFAGYELLQTVLSTGLRFGEGSLFHRRQGSNGAIICSLAAATATGIFDLQNIGAFSVRGLCLYMQTSNNPEVDSERFMLMLDTAKLLSDGLDAHLLDDQRRPLTEERIAQYQRSLSSAEVEMA